MPIPHFLALASRSEAHDTRGTAWIRVDCVAPAPSMRRTRVASALCQHEPRHSRARRALHHGLIALCAALIADTGLALDTPAAAFDASAVFVHTTGAVDRTIAWEFTVNQTLEITAIGVFDRGAPSPEPGLGAPHEVVIWDLAANVVASATVPVGTAAPKTDGYRYASVAPVTLVAGQSYLVAAFWPQTPFDHIPDVVSSGVPVVFHPDVTFVQSWVELFGFTFPTIPVASEFAAAGVNFLIAGELGTNHCLATPNSSGQPAAISASGSTSLAANDLALAAQPVPAGQNGIFFYGPTQAQLPFGNGFQCVTGQLVRLDVVTAVGDLLAFDVDYATLPPQVPITAGSTWNFQAWFRDPAAGGANFNLSDGLELAFVP